MSDQARDFGLRLQVGGPFPWHGTYRGRAVIVIAAEDYRRPKQGHPSAEAEELPAKRNAYAPRLRVSRWDRDPELKAFVSERLGKVPQTKILEEVEAAFGKDRTPTRSALSRYAVLSGPAKAMTFEPARVAI